MSTVAKRTPGPWQARFVYRMIRAARWTPGLRVASKPENDWADASLMAAAPDLLAACEGMLRAWASPRNLDRVDALCGELDAMEAAVRKANGGAS